jgi:hypothetical protein
VTSITEEGCFRIEWVIYYEPPAADIELMYGLLSIKQVSDDSFSFLS